MKYYLRIVPTIIYTNMKNPEYGMSLKTCNIKTAVKIHRLMNKDRILWNLSSDIFLDLFHIHKVTCIDGKYI